MDSKGTIRPLPDTVLKSTMEVDRYLLYSLREMRASKIAQAQAKARARLDQLNRSAGGPTGPEKKPSTPFSHVETGQDCQQPPDTGSTEATHLEKPQTRQDSLQPLPNSPPKTMPHEKASDQDSYQPHQNGSTDITSTENSQQMEAVPCLQDFPSRERMSLRLYETIIKLKLGTSYPKRPSQCDTPKNLPPEVYERISKAWYQFEGDRGSLYPRMVALRPA